MPIEQQDTLRWIQSGAAWSAELQNKIGERDNPHCMACGQRQAADHFWDCEALRQERQDCDKKMDMLGAYLPPPLRKVVDITEVGFEIQLHISTREFTST